MWEKKVTTSFKEPSPSEFMEEENFSDPYMGCEGGELDDKHEEDGELNYFEAVFVSKEEDDSVVDDEVVVRSGDAVSQVHYANTYSSCSKNGTDSKSREESRASEICLQSKHHNLASHVQPVPGSHVSEKCRKGNLKRHLLTHSDDKPYQCSNCKYRCSKKGNLKYHILTHTAVKPYQCSHCDYRCSRKGNLNHHILTHTAVKPYQCSHCGYQCSKKKENLKYHILTHTGVKPYHCPHCEYRCSRKGNLNYHIFTHTGVKPFKCSKCEYRGSRKQHIKRHMLTHSDVKPF